MSMERKASNSLKWLYCLTLAAMIFPVGLSGGSGWIGMATGGGLLGGVPFLPLLLVGWAVYRIVQVVRSPNALDVYVSGDFVKLLRGMGILLMIVGSSAALLIVFIRPLTLAIFGRPGDGGVAYFVVGVFLYVISLAGWLGIILFEASRSTGSKARPGGRGEVQVVSPNSPGNVEQSAENNTPIGTELIKRGRRAKFVMKKKFVLLVLLGACMIGIGAYVLDPYITWKEEVQLNDGRVIVVEQKRRVEGVFFREAWLTINLSEFSARPIVWHENLGPLIVNIHDGRLYVVGFPPTGREIKQYGNQAPPDIGFVWENGKWIRIPFAKIPEQIYTINMLRKGFPPRGTSFLSLEEKNGPELNGDPRGLRRLDPNQGCGCNQSQ